jgi:hypothetical protein
MREININRIMEQLGFSWTQMERWQEMQAKSECNVPTKVNLSSQPLIPASSIPSNQVFILRLASEQ